MYTLSSFILSALVCFKSESVTHISTYVSDVRADRRQDTRRRSPAKVIHLWTIMHQPFSLGYGFLLIAFIVLAIFSFSQFNAGTTQQLRTAELEQNTEDFSELEKKMDDILAAVKALGPRDYTPSLIKA